MSEGGIEIGANDMTIRARLSPTYTIKTAMIAIVCLVLGVWGVWDYAVVIPQQERFFSRAEVCRSYRQLAEPIVSGSTPTSENETVAFMNTVLDNLAIEGGAEIRSEIAGLRAAVEAGGTLALDKLGVLVVERVLPNAVRQAQAEQPTGGSVDGKPGQITTGPSSPATWFAAERAMLNGIRNRTTVSGGPSDQLRLGLQLSESQLQIYGEVERPSAYDRPVQWLFILCLPFVPWYAWQLMRNRKRTYALHADGVLDLPGESWTQDELADIDMSRWMRTSKAWAVHADGHRVLMDDYIFKGIHRIVGALASERYPDQWTDEAKKIKPTSSTDT
ncbi:MAG: hypothetical protein GY894_06010 [Planctomycetes bacterium]|jgi:hypothetical protein|nr:hypothetical protein [Planctomycetota bacterium]MCP4838902.1 hypothetical protein [Planctomycetota bacterium]